MVFLNPYYLFLILTEDLVEPIKVQSAWDEMCIHYTLRPNINCRQVMRHTERCKHGDCKRWINNGQKHKTTNGALLADVFAPPRANMSFGRMHFSCSQTLISKRTCAARAIGARPPPSPTHVMTHIDEFFTSKYYNPDTVSPFLW